MIPRRNFLRSCLLLTLLLSTLYSVLFFISAYIQKKIPFSTHTSDSHKLAVLVPFRDRFSELILFVPHLHRFLSSQNLSFSINVINQNDSLRFNRASLINAGYFLNHEECDYIAMHDVDLLPLNSRLKYNYPESGAFHLSSPELHPKYHYSNFVGGIFLMTNQDFERVNGMSNKYWGWGLEDDEFFLRIKEAGIKIYRPTAIGTGTNNTFLHVHSVGRKRDYAKLFNQKEITRKRDRETGLSNVKFKLTSSNNLIIDGYPCKVFNVELFCDLNLTPWCNSSLATKIKRGKSKKI